MKKLLISLALLFMLETVILTVVFQAFHLWQKAGAAINTFDNEISRAFIGEQAAALAPAQLVAGEQLISLTQKDLANWQSAFPAIATPNPYASVSQYFFSQTGAFHPWTAYRFSDKVKGHAINEQILGEFLLNLAKGINRPFQNAQLQIENGKATKFSPNVFGQHLDLQKSRQAVAQTLAARRTTAVLPIRLDKPQILLDDLNNLGIKELVAQGVSDFSGSTRSRINNIAVGAAQYRGLIIKANEEFSFNAHLGPVDAKNGYLPELVIKPEGATPEFGGGLCQVSTTAFRAAFFAGLPILERRNHSYAVHYYEWIADNKPKAVGLDATVYSPVQDLKFRNDTSGAILIWTRIEGQRLYFDFYGTRDNRQVVVDGPHEYDRRGDGAVKAVVSRKIIKQDLEPIEEKFYSIYIPPKKAEETYELPGGEEKINNN